MKNEINTPYHELAVLLCAMLLLLFNQPILSIADSNMHLAGIPVLFIYLLIVWIIAIIALYRISRHLFTDENQNE